MSVMAGSRRRNPATVAGVVGVMVGLLFGIGITIFAVSAAERGASATVGRDAGLVPAQLFEGRGAGLVAGRLFEAPIEVSAAPFSGRGAGLVAGRLFEALIEDE